MKKQVTNSKEIRKLMVAAILIGMVCAILGDALKLLTENYESRLFAVASRNKIGFILLPLVGLSMIYFLRYYLFRKRENKGIKEIFNSLKTRHNELPMYKIPSHFINGLLTVAFGGSTGIEVSTVVASASIGSVAQKKAIHPAFRKEMICIGVAAGVTTLFNSPIAGLLFALEVILKKRSKIAVISSLLAVCTAWGINELIDAPPFLSITVDHWNYSALPYFILLGIFAGLHGIYLTRCVLFFKTQFSRFSNPAARIITGSAILGIALLFFPQLYGDGYHAMRELFLHPNTLKLSATLGLGIVSVLFLKPIVTSATLASGGDGGVFAPGLFIGAFLGLLVALLLNEVFHAGVIPLNFMLAGMAAVLSASLHAPFTAVFLVCGTIGDFTLFIPVFTASIVAKLTAKRLLSYTVYTYHMIKPA